MAGHIIWRNLFARRVSPILLLALLVSSHPQIGVSSVSIAEVPLRDVVASAAIIVVGKVEQIASVQYPNAKEDEPELRVFDVKVEEVLKPRGDNTAGLKGTTIQAFDPRDKYQHDHYEQIEAGAISFVEKRYATKAGTVAECDHMIFFLDEYPPSDDFPLPHPYILVVGQAYELVASKAAVLQLVK